MKKLLIILILFLTLIGCNSNNSKEAISLLDDTIILYENEGVGIPLYFDDIEYDNINITLTDYNVIEYDSDSFFIRAKKVGYSKILVEIEEYDFTAEINVYVHKKEIIAPKIQTSANLIDLDNNLKIFFLNSDKVGAPIESFDFKLEDETLGYIDENYFIHPLKTGRAKLIATLKTDSSITSSFEFDIVDKIPDNKLFLSTKDDILTVKAGEYLDLYVNGSLDNKQQNYNFQSYNTFAGLVTDDGRVIGIKEGYLNIGIQSKSNSNITGGIWIKVEGTNEVDYIERLIDVALGEENYVEKYSKDTKYGEWYKFNGYDWCAMFVSWVANQSGIPSYILPKYKLVKDGKTFFESKGLFFYKEEYTPKRGDIIFFLSSGASHTGIVTKVENGRVYTIEGNTSKMVAQRSYLLDNKTITGYGTPEYNKLNNK